MTPERHLFTIESGVNTARLAGEGKVLVRNLVVVRAGDASLHQSWLQNTEGLNWDIIINYFGDDPNAFRDPGTTRIDSKGPKWPALYETLMGLGERLDRYDYVWLPDDDLACDANSINKLFDLCRLLDLELAQPSLSIDSYITYPFTIRNKSFQVRFNNFIEIMAPCFNRSFLKRCLPSFNANLSGWGLDFLWPTWVSHPTKLALIDAVSVRHTRPVGGPNYNALKEKGISPQDEMEALLLKAGIVRPEPVIRGGIDSNGALLTIWNDEHKRLIERILTGYMPEFAQHSGILFSLIAPILDDLKTSRAATAPRASA